MTDRPTCKTCSSWAPETADAYEAECRRSAPVFETGYRLAVWPTTEHGKWCGDYRPRAEMRITDRRPVISTPRVPPCGITGCNIAAVHVHSEDGGPGSSVGT